MLSVRLEEKAGEHLSRLETRIEEAKVRSEDLARVSRLASEETAAARRALEAAAQALERAGNLRSGREPAAAEPEERGGSFSAVYLLADEMADIPEISRRTGLSQGEVEMILNLRSSRAPRERGGGGRLS
jgi:hypothetical protein